MPPPPSPHTHTLHTPHTTPPTAGILFACSSGLPFIAFLIPQVRALFSHTTATGFDPHGVCVVFDGFGLGAHILWLRTMLASRAVKRELRPSAQARAAPRLASRAIHERANARRLMKAREGCPRSRRSPPAGPRPRARAWPALPLL